MQLVREEGGSLLGELLCVDDRVYEESAGGERGNAVRDAEGLGERRLKSDRAMVPGLNGVSVRPSASIVSATSQGGTAGKRLAYFSSRPRRKTIV